MNNELFEEVDAIKDVITISRQARKKMALKSFKLSISGMFPFFKRVKTSYHIPLTENKFYKVNPQNG